MSQIIIIISTLDHIVIKNIVATMRQSGSYCCDNGDNGDNSDNGKFREKNPVWCFKIAKNGPKLEEMW